MTPSSNSDRSQRPKSDVTKGTPFGPTRRALAKTAVWAVPTAVATAGAPAFATSPLNSYSLSVSSEIGVDASDDPCPPEDPDDPDSEPQAGWTAGSASFNSASFAAGNEPVDDGTMSPDTVMSISSLSITVYFPHGMIQLSGGAGGEPAFTFDNAAGSNWAGPVIRPGATSDDEGISYDSFTFTWTGDPSHETADSPAPWPDSNLSGTWMLIPDACIPHSSQYGVQVSYSFTTANGSSGRGGSTDWFTMGPIRG